MSSAVICLHDVHLLSVLIQRKGGTETHQNFHPELQSRQGKKRGGEGRKGGQTMCGQAGPERRRRREHVQGWLRVDLGSLGGRSLFCLAILLRSGLLGLAGGGLCLAVCI